MATDLEQRQKLIDLMGEGLARRIRLTVLAVWALVGIVLQGLVYWYTAQMAVKEWGNLGMLAWAVTVGLGILTVGLLGTLLWRRLKITPKDVLIEG